MKDLNYAIAINAPLEKVWEILWDDASYRQWTRYFNPGSYMESDWKLGGKTLFLDAQGNGMIATIEILEAPRTVTFSHYGILQNGVEDTTSTSVQAMAGAIEKYELEPQNRGTLLKVMVQAEPAYEQIMNNGFNKGLQEVKKLAEQSIPALNASSSI